MAIFANFLLIWQLLIILEVRVLWHLVLVVLDEIIDKQLDIVDAVRIIDVARGVLHHIVVFDDLE